MMNSSPYRIGRALLDKVFTAALAYLGGLNERSWVSVRRTYDAFFIESDLVTN